MYDETENYKKAINDAKETYKELVGNKSDRLFEIEHEICSNHEKVNARVRKRYRIKTSENTPLKVIELYALCAGKHFNVFEPLIEAVPDNGVIHEKFMTLMSGLAFQFIAYHELGHILNGHADYFGSCNDLDKQAMEIEADLFAVTNVLKKSLKEDWLFFDGDKVKIKSIKDGASLIMLCICLAIGLASLIDKNDNTDGLKVRLYHIIKSISKEVNSEYQAGVCFSKDLYLPLITKVNLILTEHLKMEKSDIKLEEIDENYCNKIENYMLDELRQKLSSFNLLQDLLLSYPCK